MTSSFAREMHVIIMLIE